MIHESRIVEYSVMNHNGMRPQDIVILLKIVGKGSRPWFNKELAEELHISTGEITYSLNRSRLARLINEDKRKVHVQSLLEFIQFGLPYVFPIEPGGPSLGLPTAHSHPLMQKMFKSEQIYVWPEATGNYSGISVPTLYPGQVMAAKKEENLYAMLAIIDVLQIGRTREVNHAIPLLKQLIKNA